jgi:hypothetical protein
MRETRRAPRERPKLPRRWSADNRIASNFAVANRSTERFVTEPDEMRSTGIAHEPCAHFILSRVQTPNIKETTTRSALRGRHLSVAAVRTKNRASV